MNKQIRKQVIVDSEKGNEEKLKQVAILGDWLFRGGS